MQSAFNFSPYVISALIGGGFTVLGWLVTSWVRTRHHRNQYVERRKDMQKAIYAEINAFVILQERNQLEKFGDSIVAKMRADETYLPFMVRERYNAVYQAMIGEIHYLPVQTIDIVTRYYQRIEFIADMKDAMSSPEYRALSPERRALIYKDYIATMRFALDEGREALHTIGLYSEGGAKAVSEYKSAQNNARSEQNKLEVKAWLDTHNNQ